LNGVDPEKDARMLLEELRSTQQRLFTFPFDQKLKCKMTVYAISEDEARVVIKGAPETISEITGTDVEGHAISMAIEGMKMLSYATRVVSMDEIKDIQDQMEQGIELDESDDLRAQIQSGVQYLGTLGIDDEVDQETVTKPICQLRFGSTDVKKDQFQTSYVKIRMFTGDHLETAKAIAKKCKIVTEVDGDAEQDYSDVCFTAQELRAHFEGKCDLDQNGQLRILVDDAQWAGAFKAFAGTAKVVARCTPEDKDFFVKVLQKNKAQCAVVGDSMADSAALKEACVGICMKDACDVAKDCSDIILLESQFTHIRTALMWGRVLNRNMQRFLTFQLTINLSIVYVTILGSIFGHPPLNVLQMLWANLVMDILAAIALGTEKWVELINPSTPGRWFRSLSSWACSVAAPSKCKTSRTLTTRFRCALPARTP
jgi:magnesium-transporting ATPase (P-type)